MEHRICKKKIIAAEQNSHFTQRVVHINKSNYNFTILLLSVDHMNFTRTSHMLYITTYIVHVTETAHNEMCIFVCFLEI